MKNILLKISSFAIVLLFLVGMNSCVKDEFDTPPLQDFPTGDHVDVSEIIALALTATSSDPVRITEDKSMFGLVTMGEQSGNFYKQVAFKDVTGGILLGFLGSTSLNVGDSVQVNLKGARIYHYNKLPQIDSLEITYNLRKISAGNEFTPKEVTLVDIKNNTTSYTGQVVKLIDVQFPTAELGNTFADPLVNTNRDIEDCNDKSILIRTSGYANFANKLLPEGNGSLIGFVSQFGEEAQVLIRDYSEVDMAGTRCGDEPGGGGPVEPVDSVNEDFESYDDYEVIEKSGWTSIVVAGDRPWIAREFGSDMYAQASGYNSGLAEMETWNITPPVKNIGSKMLSFKSAIDHWTHTSGHPASIFVSENFVGDNFETATWIEIFPTIATQANSDYEWVESGDYDLSAFNGDAAIAFKYVGSVTESTGFRIDNVVIGDGTGGGGGGGVEPVEEVNEDFGGLVDYDEITMEGWTNYIVAGDRSWIAKVYENNPYAQASGYESGLDIMETWMITPPVTNIQDKKLSFSSAQAYWTHTTDAPVTVLVSENYDGENFETATWTEIDVTIATQSTTEHEWIESGDYDLSAFSGNAAIAFKYVGSDAVATTIRIDNILVQ